MKVALFGGTGFVGGHLVEALIAAGHTPSLLVRVGSEGKLRHADRCRITHGDISSDRAIDATLADCGALIYNIGILKEYPGRGITFEELQYRGAARVVEVAKRRNVSRVLLMSANGVKHPGTPYQETKFRAEEAVRKSTLDFTIFRPSVIFGDSHGLQEISSQLYNDLVRPPIPAVGFHTGWSPKDNGVVLSPVHVKDVANAFVAALTNDETIGRTYVLGGPEVLTWSEMVRRIAVATGRKKWILPMPVGFMKFGATLFDWLPFFPATRDQLTMLAEGNAADAADIESLIGRPPLGFVPANLSYLQG
ncbi:MAG: NAD(P)H-binding protein [Gammaproteobacteria bacterium]|nr:NAD(P)H-binding protein [Gammaproteobacteria bacterium]MDH3372827.1 NAD(P)H-binding protein [Gammaproteobacteria bacterium]MDH3407981.1 NAD(P)H-binding protein [Gammaproteobacteria bacterium]MDH3551294.1 NAD(P)H-binding protein [Gammaproteobacteria bacterium]